MNVRLKNRQWSASPAKVWRWLGNVKRRQALAAGVRRP